MGQNCERNYLSKCVTKENRAIYLDEEKTVVMIFVKLCKKTTKNAYKTNLNIAGRLPENSRNSFIDLQSQKTVKKTDQKYSSFH